MNCYPFIEAEKGQQRNVKRACELLEVSPSVDCLGCLAARMASTHARTRSASRSAQIIQLGRARLERGRRPPAMQNGGYFACAGGPMQTSLCGCLAGAGYVVLSMMRS